MKKFILSLVILLLILFALKAPLTSAILSYKTELSTHIGSLRFSTEGITIENFSIKNPKKAERKNALEAKRLVIKAPFSSYFKNNTVIDSIAIQDITIDLEFYDANNTQGNWSALMSHLHKKNDDSSKHVTSIKQLDLENISIFLKKSGEPMKQLAPIPSLHLKNLSSAKGIPYRVIAKVVIQETIRSITSIKGITNMLNSLMIELPQKGLKSFFDPLKKLLQKSEESPQKTP